MRRGWRISVAWGSCYSNPGLEDRVLDLEGHHNSQEHGLFL